MKYSEWLIIWLDNYVKPCVKKRTAEIYERIVQTKINAAIGRTELDRLSAMGIQAYVTELLTSGNSLTGKGLAASSVNTVITVIQSSLKTAFLLGYIPKNIAEAIKRPKITQKQIDCFTISEQKQIEKAALSSGNNKLFGVVLCLYTGLRIGELLALSWNDVDTVKGLIRVTKTCRDGRTNDGFGRILDEPKTPSSKRVVPVPKQLLPLLRKLKKSEKSEYVVSFCGQPFTIRAYQKQFSGLLAKIGVRHKCFHSLRHTFATRALESGMDVKTLSEILGHKNAAVTLNRYAHSLIEHKRETMNKLGKLFLQ